MDVIAYWFYASLQAIAVVVMLDTKGDLKRAVTLGFLTFMAPLVTAGLFYLAMGKLIDWLQSPNKTT